MAYGDLPSAGAGSNPVGHLWRGSAPTVNYLAEERARHAETELPAEMSHEFEAPINAIIGLSEIIESKRSEPVGTASEAVFEYAQCINRSGRQPLNLLDDILSLSAKGTGQSAVRESDVDVDRLVRSCLSHIAEQAIRQELTIELDAPEEIPGLRADPSRLRQILLHMLSNAAKFTPAGGTIVLLVDTDQHGDLGFSVRDPGFGMRTEDIPAALAPFGQVEGAMFRSYAGSGLGLPLTKASVEMHGGRFHVDSRPGVGTTATAWFPKHRVVRRARVGPDSGTPSVM